MLHRTSTAAGSRSTIVAVLTAAAAVAVTSAALVPEGRIAAATITGAYVAGYRDVTINGYGTSGLGAFELDTGTGTGRRTAWCIESHVAHTTGVDAYEAVPTIGHSSELDTLLWILERSAPLDHDTATAGAALAWWYADARRSIGPPVWSDGSNGFSPVDPMHPYDWADLPPVSLAQPIGLRSGSIDLDAAERRVAELQSAVTAWQAPWQISPGEASRFVVSGPGGPIVGVDVTLTIRIPGRPDSNTVMITGPDGSVSAPAVDANRGGTVIARVAGPGPHQEWDGAGDTQRLATATTVVHEAAIEIAPPHRHIEIEKVSADPTISPSGAVFDIVDQHGRLTERVRTGPDGRVRVAPIDATLHPPPYRIVEIEAPLGLESVAPIDLDDASTDPERPTIVQVVDPPLLVDVVVRKRLSVPSVGPTDRSGFQFHSTRTADGAMRSASTGPDGSTEPFGLALGEYRICEIGTPAWADGLLDEGCRTLTITPDDLDRSGPITIDYVNTVASPSIDTQVADVVDGDRQLPPEGGHIIDQVELDGLVPETSYRITGAVLSHAGDPTGITSVIEFRATDHRFDLELEFTVPALAPGRYVVVEHLEVIGDDENVLVATHHDLADVDQTFFVEVPRVESSTEEVGPDPVVPPAIPSTLPSTGADQSTLRRALHAADVTFVLGAFLGVLGGLRRTVGR